MRRRALISLAVLLAAVVAGAAAATAGSTRVHQVGAVTAPQVRDLAVSPDGRNVYAATAEGMLTFARDTRTGALTPASVPVDGTPDPQQGARSVAVSGDGRSVYVGSAGGGPIAVYARDVATGQLTAKGSPATHGAGGGQSLQGTDVAVSADGHSVYMTSVAGNSLLTFARDTRSGTLRQLTGRLGCVAWSELAGCAAGPGGLESAQLVAVSPDGRFVVAGGERAVSFVRDPRSGRLTRGRNVPSCANGACGQVWSFAFAPNGQLYMTTVGGRLLGFRYHARRGLVQLAHASAIVRGSAVATVSAGGRAVYVVGAQGSTVTALRRDTKTGALKPLPSARLQNAPHPAAIAASRDGRSVYVGSDAGIAVLARG
ncbi:MAG TPA: beta-propeller fold lactonase family protein [Thermoleophilaceae bacterium]|nr:beta-propeller fold lactonase family protein [Thermoleophilaceae bacterium]